MVFTRIKDFFALEASGGVMLVAVTLLAMVAANSPLVAYYGMLHTHVATVAVNDGLMAFFFLMIGLEIRQEMDGGALMELRQLLLPMVAALGGVVVPAAIFLWFNGNLRHAKQ